VLADPASPARARAWLRLHKTPKSKAVCFSKKSPANRAEDFLRFVTQVVQNWNWIIAEMTTWQRFGVS
jgi:hypothetical protein